MAKTSLCMCRAMNTSSLPSFVNIHQARSQGTFEVEALLGRGFGGRLEAPPMGPGRSPGGSPGAKPPEANGFYSLTVHFLL